MFYILINMFSSCTVLMGFLLLRVNSAQGDSRLTPELQELADMLHAQCQEETEVPEDVIIGARTGKFLEDNRLKCYMKCLMVQMASLDEDDGEVDIEATIAVIPDGLKDKGEKIIRKCGTKRGSDLCDTAFQTNWCWYETSPNDYFLA